MYRQILVRPDQRRFQLIFWRSDHSEPLRSYQLNTVTYGTASAAYLAVRCLHQLAIENEQQFSQASHIIKTDFYVDDLLTGSNSLEELATLCKDISNILSQRCFELRKWVSNHPDILTVTGIM
ncbi:unnamed protein product [Acanthoscelides obtectus]|uniref:Uncharacterized protein n=1 Tax=Acanthoscelides obtectus TaxID=200917 RepID=A0A9P0PLP2_ACAOB|nr:unnamed protein product [Acanthoscelides obtectus]CAK1632770.1 hypothetical protein AOBTE_LOCUS7722 [Acanthoscelides obtectus]